jgi:hypothetical protein
MRRTKQLQPAAGDDFFDAVFRPTVGESTAAAAAFTIRASRAASGFCFVNRKIWWSAYQPSSVSGGCAISGEVMP